MLATLKKMGALLSAREKLHLVLLAFLIAAAGLFETLGVASVLPYMSLLITPESEISQRVFAYAGRFSGVDSREHIVVVVGVCVLVGVVGGTLLSGFATWFALRFALLRIHTMSQRVLASYLMRDYEFFILRHSSNLLKNLLSEVSNVVGGILTPLIQMSTRIVVAVLLAILLFVVNFAVAAVSIGVFLAFYLAIYTFTRRKLSSMGEECVAANDARFQTLSELFSGIREVKLWNKEEHYYAAFSRASARFADLNSSNQLIALLPRYALEMLAFGGMVLVTIVLASSSSSFATYIPLLSLYAAAGYKLLPSLQQIYVNLAAIRYCSASLDTLVEESRSWLAETDKPQRNVPAPRARHLEREIRFENVTYQYPRSDRPAVGPLNLSIPAFSTTGIVGSSGAGKSTVLDLMLGLLPPTSGKIWIDDFLLERNSRQSWASVVGYVSQSIYLTASTVAENIAFGTLSDEIDMQAVEEAARAAQVWDVIQALPEKFATRLGERGLRLSGGQRQRIAIARALYRKPEILIFDEATSALDSETEEAVMESIRMLAHQKTIVIVTHRLSTLRDCERLYTLEGGRAVQSEISQTRPSETPSRMSKV